MTALAKLVGQVVDIVLHDGSTVTGKLAQADQLENGDCLLIVVIDAGQAIAALDLDDDVSSITPAR